MPRFALAAPSNYSKRRKNFLLANCHLPAIIWCFVACNTLAKCSTVDVSVWGFRHRAFVFAAPMGFVAGSRLAKRGEPFSVGAIRSALSGDANKF
jgi:hypothetical protein